MFVAEPVNADLNPACEIFLYEFIYLFLWALHGQAANPLQVVLFITETACGSELSQVQSQPLSACHLASTVWHIQSLSTIH